MTTIAFVSIILASCALALVAAIMSGFEHETRSIVQGIHPDLTIQAGGRPLRYDAIKETILKTYQKDIVGISPSTQGHVLVKATDQEGVGVLGVIIGIDPKAEATVSKLPSLIQKENQALPAFKDLFEREQIVIGTAMAESTGAKAGSSVMLLFSSDQEEATSGNQVLLEQKQVTVSGIFKTGIEDVDAHVLFCSLDLFKSLFPESGITAINLKLVKPQEEAYLKKELKNLLLGLTILSWQDLYPALLSALMLEKYAMILVLALIGLVACVTIISLFFMYITHKKGEIALLRTLGVKQPELIRLFVGMGGCIGLIGALIGIFLATGISLLLNEYHLIKLPSVYYISHVPAHMSVDIGIAVIILVTITSCIAAYIPARTLQSIDVTDLLKESY